MTVFSCLAFGKRRFSQGAFLCIPSSLGVTFFFFSRRVAVTVKHREENWGRTMYVLKGRYGGVNKTQQISGCLWGPDTHKASDRREGSKHVGWPLENREDA